MILLQVEKEIGQVWRQMGIMYSKVSNSIEILEKVIGNIIKQMTKVNFF